MAKVIGIQFQKNGKMYYFNPGQFSPSVGDYVILDTVRGLDLGEVIMSVREVESSSEDSLKLMVRFATEEDILHATENREKEREAFRICQRKIAEHLLEMKLVSVEYAFDGSKILFYFTANGRVDFRSLVKDLASAFKTRIELRQIGVRDEARMLGGLGPCGRPLCCGTFLTDFQPVSIKMAKEQNLSLNPTKISGVCGRLMCCLKYEQDHYEQTRKKMPRLGREVNTPDGSGQVTELNIVKETVKVRIANGDTSEIREYPLEQISRENAQPARPAPQPDAGVPEEAEQAAPDAVIPEEIRAETAVSAAEEPITDEFDAMADLDEMDIQAVRERKPNRAAKGKKPQERTARKPRAPRPPANGAGKAPAPDKNGDQAKDGNTEKAAGNRPGRKLGQPVRRENPNRKPQAAPDAAPAAAPAPSRKTAWADQLEKAIRDAEKPEK